MLNLFIGLASVMLANVLMGVTATEIAIVTGSDRTNATAYVILEYTKTTD